MEVASDLRLRTANNAPLSPEGAYVLYWMIAARRTTWNFALDRAVAWAKELGKPLVVFESLRVGYPWASDRMHRFVLEGMADNARRMRGTTVVYYPYVEPQAGADQGLLAALAASAAVVVTDEFPAFFLPRMVAAAARALPVTVEVIDSNGLLPLRAADKVFSSAYQFRRFLHKQLRPHLEVMPQEDPLRGAKLPRANLPEEIIRRWPPADLESLLDKPDGLAALPINHAVGPASFRGGAIAGRAAFNGFLEKLDRYLEDRNEPEAEGTSGLSPYLHFGHLAPHEAFCAIAERARWTPDKLSSKPTGKREGWWNMGPAAEAFLDQLITWRELGYNMCALAQDYDRYESLPDWARATLEQHAGDRRQFVYSLAQFEQAATHDPLWNAAERQLVREGRLHNYLRMLWGKKILEWTASPQEALAVMIELNNKYAVDGRDPNSYSGIFWCLGRYDRPWGPERPIFGKIRYMSSENTARKLSVRGYLEEYATF